ncbi:MAG: hypothetical protein PHT58_03680 [Eubacteriales bacterium]|nr:hypothetical protein [Eubacteriales bacterium]
MDASMITAIISGVGTLAGSLIGIIVSNRLTNYRIEQLEKKVEKHNNLVERMVVVEQRSKSNTHRLDDIERA